MLADQPITLEVLEKPANTALHDLVDLAEVYDSITHTREIILRTIYTGREFGWVKIRESPVLFLKIAASLRDERILKEALLHMVGKQLTSEDDQAFTGAKLSALVKNQIKLAKGQVRKTYAALIASDLKVPNRVGGVIIQHSYNNFLEHYVVHNDPFGVESFRALRNFATYTELPGPLHRLEPFDVDLQKFQDGINDIDLGYSGAEEHLRLCDIEQYGMEEFMNELSLQHLETVRLGLNKMFNMRLSKNALRGHMLNLLLEKQKTVLELFPDDGEPTYPYFTFLRFENLEYPWP